MSNFAFVQAPWPELYEVCQRAESYAISDPNAAAFTARIAVENIVDYGATIVRVPAAEVPQAIATAMKTRWRSMK